jgi:extradiol dioxygenase family protein
MAMAFGAILGWCSIWMPGIQPGNACSGPVSRLSSNLVRFKGQAGEQARCFRDPAGSHLELKAFENLDHCSSASIPENVESF